MFETYLLVFALVNIVLFIVAAILVKRDLDESEAAEAPEPARHVEAAEAPPAAVAPVAVAAITVAAPVPAPAPAPPKPEPAEETPPPVQPSQPSVEKELPWPMVPLTLVESTDPKRFWRIAVASGMERSKMLVLAPDSPAVVTGKYGLAGAKVWRITRTEGEENVNPGDLEKIGYLIEKHLEQGAGRAVLLHGLARFIDAQGFRNARRLLDVARESAETNRGAVLALIDPGTLEPAQLRQLEEGASVIRL
jgi:hypothetical protein